MECFRKGAEIGVDILTHMPMYAKIPDDIVKEIVEKNNSYSYYFDYG